MAEEKQLPGNDGSGNEPFTMMFPGVGAALDVPPDKLTDFFDDFISVNWSGAPADDFLSEYGGGFRPMSEEESDKLAEHGKDSTQSE